MRKINKISRRGVVNLFADFILTRIDKKENSIIQVTDCESFMVIHGQTTSKEVLNLDKIKTDFIEWFKDILDEVGIKQINTLDIIRYGPLINIFAVYSLYSLPTHSSHVAISQLVTNLFDRHSTVLFTVHVDMLSPSVN